MIELVLGGARSGKSRYAELTAVDTRLPLIYIATATVYDDEMRERVGRHQSDRQQQGVAWKTVEEPILLADTIRRYADQECCILVDCLTLWLTNSLLADDPECWAQQKQALLNLLSEPFAASLLLVSNEVGQGIVPLGELNRRFVDEAGWLHQALAQQADKVTLVTAGLPMTLKG